MNTPADFKPTVSDPTYFRQDVYSAGYGYSFRINPSYCATAHTASVMKLILAQFQPKVIELPPLGAEPFGGGWMQTSPVPWLDFGNGVKENAGLLAHFWTHGQPLDFVEREVIAMVQQEIDAAAG